jgi:hypothetical protein
MLSKSSSSSSSKFFLKPTFRRKKHKQEKKEFEEVKERSSTDSKKDIIFGKKIILRGVPHIQLLSAAKLYWLANCTVLYWQKSLTIPKISFVKGKG